jgi:hypothetical protein
MFSERSLVFRLFGFLMPMCCLLAMQACTVHPADDPFHMLDRDVTPLSVDCVHITVVDSEACHPLSWWSDGAVGTCMDRDEALTTIQPAGSCPDPLTFPAVEFTCCRVTTPEPTGPTSPPKVDKIFGMGSSIPTPGFSVDDTPSSEDEETCEEDEKEPFFNPPKK